MSSPDQEFSVTRDEIVRFINGQAGAELSAKVEEAARHHPELFAQVLLVEPPPGESDAKLAETQAPQAPAADEADLSIWGIEAAEEMGDETEENSGRSFAEPDGTLAGGQPGDQTPAEPLPVESMLPTRIVARNLAEGRQADYAILGKVDEGGQGVVFAAQQMAVQRNVALKLPKRDGEAAILVREGIATGRLEHPNIIPIYDVGSARTPAGRPFLFYSMKFLNKKKGWRSWEQQLASDFPGDLDDQQREQRIEEHVRILLRVAEAVAFAHSRHIVHRDLKPSNVWLGEYGEVLVCDWGLARSVAEEEPFKTPGPRPEGSYEYMAPEMAHCERIGRHSDIYLLGGLLHRVLAGRPPHQGDENTASLYRAMENLIVGEPPSGEADGLWAIARRAMATRPEDRYPSAEALIEAVKTHLDHSQSVRLTRNAEQRLATAEAAADVEAFQEADYGFRYALQLWSENERARAGLTRTRVFLVSRKRLRRMQAAFAVVVGLLLVCAAALGLYALDQRARKLKMETQAAEADAAAAESKADAAESKAEAAISDAEAAESKAKAAASERKRIEDAAKKQKELDEERVKGEQKLTQQAEYDAFVQRIGLASQRIRGNAFDGARDLLHRIRAEKRSNWEWRRLDHLCNRAEILQQDAGQIESVLVAADGAVVAVGDGGFVGVSASIAERKRPLPLNAWTTKPLEGARIRAAAVLPGNRLALGGGKNESLAVFDLATRQQLWAGGDPQGKPVTSLAVVWRETSDKPPRTEHFLVSASEGPTIQVWKIEPSGALTFQKNLERNGKAVWSVAASPDGEQFVSASEDGYVYVWARTGSKGQGEWGEPRRFMGHGNCPVYAAAFSPDGGRIASGDRDGRILLWAVADAEAFNYKTLEPKAGEKPRPPEPPRFVRVGKLGGAVRSLDWSPDGNRLIAAGEDNCISVWRRPDAKKNSGWLAEKLLQGHGNQVRSCKVVPGTSMVVSAAHDGRVLAWDLDRHEVQRELAASSPTVAAARLAPDGTFLALAGDDGTLRVWPRPLGQVRPEKPLDYQIDLWAGFEAAALSPDGRTLYAVAAHGKTFVWNVASGSVGPALEETGARGALAVSQHWLLTGGPVEKRSQGADSASAKLWSRGDDGTTALAASLPCWTGEVTATAISKDERLLFAGDSHGRCFLWDAQSRAPIAQWRWHEEAITAAAFLNGGRQLLTASLDHAVVAWEIAAQPRQLALYPHRACVLAMDVSADGRSFLTGTSSPPCPDERRRPPDGRLCLWRVGEAEPALDIATGDESVHSVAFGPDGSLWTLGGRALRRFVGGQETYSRELATDVRRLAFTPAGELLTVANKAIEIRKPTDSLPAVRLGPHRAIRALDIAPDSRTVVTAGDDRTVRLWKRNADESFSISKTLVRPGCVTCAVFSPQGDRLLTIEKPEPQPRTGEALLWTADLAGGQTYKHDGVCTAAFSPDGQRLATAAADGTVRIWSASDPKKTPQAWKAHVGPVRAIAFSPDGRWLATAGDDNKARLWTAGGQKLGEDLAGHSAAVTAVAFSPDGSRLVTASQDATAKLWDIEIDRTREPLLPHGKELLTLDGHAGGIATAAFSRDGNTIVTAGQLNRGSGAIFWLTSPREPGR